MREKKRKEIHSEQKSCTNSGLGTLKLRKWCTGKKKKKGSGRIEANKNLEEKEDKEAAAENVLKTKGKTEKKRHRPIRHERCSQLTLARGRKVAKKKGHVRLMNEGWAKEGLEGRNTCWSRTHRKT